VLFGSNLDGFVLHPQAVKNEVHLESLQESREMEQQPIQICSADIA